MGSPAVTFSSLPPSFWACHTSFSLFVTKKILHQQNNKTSLHSTKKSPPTRLFFFPSLSLTHHTRPSPFFFFSRQKKNPTPLLFFHLSSATRRVFLTLSDRPPVPRVYYNPFIFENHKFSSPFAFFPSNFLFGLKKALRQENFFKLHSSAIAIDIPGFTRTARPFLFVSSLFNPPTYLVETPPVDLSPSTGLILPSS